MPNLVSACTVPPAAPIVEATSSSLSRRRARMATVAPSAASLLVVAVPMPLLAPVTSVTVFASDMPSYRVAQTRANGQPALGLYMCEPDGTVFHALGLLVLEACRTEHTDDVNAR
jgi:hypothetical protein